MQVMAIEFARNVLGLYEADSTEFGDTKHKVICLAEEFANTDGVMQRRDECSNKGGTMRLGSYPYKFKDKVSTDRHRHRYEFNNWYRELFEEYFDLGVSLDDRFVEIMQLKDHPFYIGCQFHPEFNSTIHKPHWLFEGFLLWGIYYESI
jgi:CTP synthase